MSNLNYLFGSYLIQADGERSCGFYKSDILMTNDFIKSLSCDISTTTASLSEVSPTTSTPVCPENQYWGVPQYTTCGVLSYYYCCEKPEQVIYMPDPTIVDEPSMRPVFNVCKVSTDCAAWTSPGCTCSQGKIKNQNFESKLLFNLFLNPQRYG